MDDCAALSRQTGGAGGATSYEALQRADAAWAALRARGRATSSTPNAPGRVVPSPPAAAAAPFVVETGGDLPALSDPFLQFDAIVAGGTLGIFLATALQVLHHGPHQQKSVEPYRGDSPYRSESLFTPLFPSFPCPSVCGPFLATALQLRGWRVAVVEAGRLEGRAQEWNICRWVLLESL